MWQKLASLFGGDVLKEVNDLIKTFKLPPEQQLAYEQKTAELKATVETRALELEMSDRDSARKREMEVKDHTPRNLAYGITIALLSTLVYFNVYPPNAEVKPLVEDAVMALRDGWLVVIAYYFGSSHKKMA